MLHNKVLQDLSNNYRKVADLEEQGSTGLKVRYPSDDAIVATRASNAYSRVREMEQFKRNGNTVGTYLNLYDSVTQEMSSLVTNIKELVVRGATDSMTKVDRESIAQEIDKIKDHMVQLANTNISGEHIFAGADAANAPVNDDGTIAMEAKANVKQSTNLGGYEFSYGISVYDAFVVEGNESIFNLLDNISKNLKEDNPSGYLNDVALEKVERFEYTVQRTLSKVGSSQKFLDMSTNRFEEYTNFLTDYVSKEQDAEFLETYTKLTNQKTILDAALKTGGSLLTTSLVDFVN
jgi:flagellar hook-associated protein 3 FlgL